MEFETFIDAILERDHKRRIRHNARMCTAYLKLFISSVMLVAPFISSMWIYCKLACKSPHSDATIISGGTIFAIGIITSYLLLRDLFKRHAELNEIEISFLTTSVLVYSTFEIVHYALFTTELLSLVRRHILGVGIHTHLYHTVIHLAITFAVYSAMHVIIISHFFKRDSSRGQVVKRFLDSPNALQMMTQIVGMIYMFYAVIMTVFCLCCPEAFQSFSVSPAQARHDSYVTAFMYATSAVTNLLLIGGLNFQRRNIPQCILRRTNLLLVLLWITLMLLISAVEIKDIVYWLYGIKDMALPHCKEITVLVIGKIGVINYGMTAILLCFWKEMHAILMDKPIRENDSNAIPMSAVFSRVSNRDNTCAAIGHDTYI